MSNDVTAAEINTSFEQWELLANTTQASTDNNVREQLRVITLNQFRKSHLLVNEALSGLDEQVASDLADESTLFDVGVADRIIELAQRRKSIIELSLSYPKLPTGTAETDDSELASSEVDIVFDQIVQAIGGTGENLNHSETQLLRTLLALPGTEMTKKQFLDAGLVIGDAPSIFTGTISALINKVNASTSKFRIEKVLGQGGYRARGYKITQLF
jgi:hypothetical protein